MLPARFASTPLPGASDNVPVKTELARETLPERKGREVGHVPRERPHAIRERHRIQAGDSSGVVGNAGVCAGFQIDGDDRQAVGCLGDRDLGTRLASASPLLPITVITSLS